MLGGACNRLSRWENLGSRRKLNVMFTSSRTYLDSSGVIIASGDEAVENPHSAWRWNVQSQHSRFLRSIRFIKTSGSVSGVVADEWAMCLALTLDT